MFVRIMNWPFRRWSSSLRRCGLRPDLPLHPYSRPERRTTSAPLHHSCVRTSTHGFRAVLTPGRKPTLWDFIKSTQYNIVESVFNVLSLINVNLHSIVIFKIKMYFSSWSLTISQLAFFKFSERHISMRTFITYLKKERESNILESNSFHFSVLQLSK